MLLFIGYFLQTRCYLHNWNIYCHFTGTDLSVMPAVTSTILMSPLEYLMIDCVNQKLTSYGVRGDGYRWMRSFLYSRVSVHGILSVRFQLVYLKAPRSLKQVSIFTCSAGVYIDPHLTKHYVEYVLWRVHGKLHSINHLKPLTPTVMRLLYQAHVLPIIDVVWVSTNVGHLKRLERLQTHFSSFSSSVFNLEFILQCRYRKFKTSYHLPIYIPPSDLLNLSQDAMSITCTFRLWQTKHGAAIWNSLPARWIH